jgi:4-hydroxy-tetrahydrodipicolinate synthase
MTTINAPLLHGVISALVTPTTADGDPDTATLRALVDRSIEQGIHGLIVGAGTGEAASLSDAQKRELAEIVVKQVNGRIPVVVGTGAVSTEHAVSQSVHAQSIGASAVMPVPPYYDPITLEATFEYYRAIDAAIEIPIMAYNHPAATGTPLPADFLGRLGRELEHVEYLKDSSGDMGQISRLLTHYGDDIKLLCGDELLYLPSLELGAHGCVAGVANFMAGPLVRVYEAYIRGEYATALEEWQRVVPALLAVIDAGPWHAAVKAATEISGLPVGEPRSPIQPLDKDARERLGEVLTATLAGEFTLA